MLEDKARSHSPGNKQSSFLTPQPERQKASLTPKSLPKECEAWQKQFPWQMF